jgi:hypothetical protein
MTQLTAHLPEPLRWDVFAVSAGHGPVSVWMRQRTPAEEARAERLAILYPCPTHQQVQMAVTNGNERQPN